MYNCEWVDDPEANRSRPTSRRNSGPFSRRGSVKKEPEGSKIHTPPTSTSSTPKKIHHKQQNLDFVVTGKQLLKRGDRANSLPGTYHRRQSMESLKAKRSMDSPKRINTTYTKSRDASLEDDVSLDLSQVSDFEDLSMKYGMKDKLGPLATSTPKKLCQKVRSCSVQSNPSSHQREPKSVKVLESKKSRDSMMSSSRDSVCKTSSSGSYRHAVSTELDYSSMSPEYSAASSGDSVAGVAADTLVSPRSQDLQDSFCVSTWQECSVQGEGEWGHFWANYNNSLAKVPISRYYDQCPTPYRSEDIELADLEFSTDGSRKRSPDNIKTINNIIRNEGLRLTPRETQNVIKCAHILGNVLTKAVERQTKEREFSSEKIQELVTEKPDPEKEIKKKTMSLDLKETVIPLEVKEEKRWESVPTQTDISLPNTKSAPKIFESILRQLSMTSIEEQKVIPDIPEEKKIETPNNSEASDK